MQPQTVCFRAVRVHDASVHPCIITRDTEWPILCWCAVKQLLTHSHPCITSIVNIICWKVSDIFSPNFQHWCILGQVKAFQVFGSRGQSSSHSGLQDARNALLPLLTWHFENYWTEFRQTFSVDAFWGKDEWFNFWS